MRQQGPEPSIKPRFVVGLHTMASPPPAIVLHDGDCGFCTRSVLFIFHRDPSGRYHFASLDSDIGRRLLRSHGVSKREDSLVLIDEERAFVRSTATLRIARGLRWPWLAALGLLVPRRWRDAAYRGFAARRHRWWGQNHCADPSPELRQRMLDQE